MNTKGEPPAMLFFEPHVRDRKLFPHDPFKGMIIPRPIGWISTMSRAGAVNLAPYSYFNGFSTTPMIVGFSSEGEKDSQAFAIETGEFVWSMATYGLREQMNATSAPLERKVTQVVRLTDVAGADATRVLVLGQVVGMHVDERFLKNGRLDAVAMQTIARCGYDEYTVIDRVFSLARPAGGGNAFGGKSP